MPIDRTRTLARPMTRGLVLAVIAVLATNTLQAAFAAPAAPSAEAIAERNVAARGGLAAWRSVHSLVVAGRLEAGSADSVARSERLATAESGTGVKARRAVAESNAQASAAHGQVELPFRLEMKEPHKSRMEIDFNGRTAVQLYDGVSGWKLRPYLNRDDYEPFSADEAKGASAMGDLQPLLVDYAAKGSRLELEGVEPVDGHETYRLRVTARDGKARHVWVDTHSFLDVRVEGLPRQFNGQRRTVTITQRDFRDVKGLRVPFQYDTAVESGRETHKMLLDTVAVNRPLDDGRFTKPAPAAGAAAAVARN